jgi:hypothetical protein
MVDAGSEFAQGAELVRRRTKVLILSLLGSPHEAVFGFGTPAAAAERAIERRKICAETAGELRCPL